MRTHVLENLAFGHGFCCLRWPHRPLPSVAVVLLAMYICRPFCGHFCSVLLSALFCLRLCFLRLGALLFSIPFSFRDGIPDIGDGACLFFFRCPPRDFRLRCRYPLYRFADASPGMGHCQQLLQTWSPLQERCCASQDSKAHAACFTLNSVHGNWGFGFCNWGLGFARYDLHEPSQDWKIQAISTARRRDES